MENEELLAWSLMLVTIIGWPLVSYLILKVPTKRSIRAGVLLVSLQFASWGALRLAGLGWRGYWMDILTDSLVILAIHLLLQNIMGRFPKRLRLMAQWTYGLVSAPTALVLMFMGPFSFPLVQLLIPKRSFESIAPSGKVISREYRVDPLLDAGTPEIFTYRPLPFTPFELKASHCIIQN